MINAALAKAQNHFGNYFEKLTSCVIAPSVKSTLHRSPGTAAHPGGRLCVSRATPTAGPRHCSSQGRGPGRMGGAAGRS